jgi:hypothetical protein
VARKENTSLILRIKIRQRDFEDNKTYHWMQRTQWRRRNDATISTFRNAVLSGNSSSSFPSSPSCVWFLFLCTLGFFDPWSLDLSILRQEPRILLLGVVLLGALRSWGKNLGSFCPAAISTCQFGGFGGWPANDLFVALLSTFEGQ